ncbi:MAG: hypothetical protein D3904_10970 [Candidatus Electrothrix sp. EH2]|nr:hypothetical protein [Candidatus Electrothrix sp. EH2]
MEIARVTKLTAVQVRNARQKEKAYKLADGQKRINSVKRMKMDNPHNVPLSTQAIAIWRKWDMKRLGMSSIRMLEKYQNKIQKPNGATHGKSWRRLCSWKKKLIVIILFFYSC